MQTYRLIPGTQPVLPPFMDGRTDLLAIPYPASERWVAAVVAPDFAELPQITTHNSVNVTRGKMRIEPGQYHIVLGPYLNYAIDAAHVRTRQQPPVAHHIFLEEKSLDASIHHAAGLLLMFWGALGFDVRPVGLSRLAPAIIVGQLPAQAGVARLQTENAWIDIGGGDLIVQEADGSATRAVAYPDMALEFRYAQPRVLGRSAVLNFERPNAPFIRAW